MEEELFEESDKEKSLKWFRKLYEHIINTFIRGLFLYFTIDETKFKPYLEHSRYDPETKTFTMILKFIDVNEKRHDLHAEFITKQ